MAKIMLVEDDNNLREIYEARLLAEGYEIVSAKDGEEALALAVKERPDLIISDVMMPKISGFDMLDILRSTAETKDTKVIMMTALSQAEDKSRADKLGADRYLVKSQVTLEDVAKVAREVLQDDGSKTPPPSAAPTDSPSVSPPTAGSDPSLPAGDAPQGPAVSATQPPAAMPVAEPPATTPATNSSPNEPTTVPPQAADTDPIQDNPSVNEVNPIKTDTSPNNVAPEPQSTEVPNNGEGDNASSRKRIIQPISDPTVKPDLNALLQKEEQANSSTPPPASSAEKPGEPTVLPPNSVEAPDSTKPDNATQGGHDPNSISL